MCVKSDQAVDLYRKACQWEQQGETNLAEVYYLKSWSLFEQAGGSYYLNAANAMNALAFLRWSRKDYEGAFHAAKESMRIMETKATGFASADSDLIRSTAWELIDQISYEIRLACEVKH
jgi:hypothetical protein